MLVKNNNFGQWAPSYVAFRSQYFSAASGTNNFFTYSGLWNADYCDVHSLVRLRHQNHMVRFRGKKKIKVRVKIRM